MSGINHHETEKALPRLWNPNAAANWSILFTPAFGAFCYAANWRTLGDDRRARANTRWAWTAIGVWLSILVLAIVNFFILPLGSTISNVTLITCRWLPWVILLGWYLSEGRPHARFVRDSLGKRYLKRGWAFPILTALPLWALYVFLFVGLPLLLTMRDWNELSSKNGAGSLDLPSMVAAETKRAIEIEWQKAPETRGTTISDISLTPNGSGTYSGFANTLDKNTKQRVVVDVSFEGGLLRWQLKPIVE